MTTSALAKKFGVNRETIRFYERQRLLPKPRRTDNGYRQYDVNAEKTLSFILKAKNLGFTLAEIKALLSIRLINNDKCKKIRTQAQEKLKDVEDKILYLQKLKGSLEKLVASCINSQTPTYCPILDNLES